MRAWGAFRFVRITYALCMCITLSALQGRAASGATRRALIVGIDHYLAVNASADRAKPLKGAVNDAVGIKNLLVANFGFKDTDVILLPDEKATRSQILQKLSEHLAEAANPGDLSLFFFAGHGSWYQNRKSRESDAKDETLVPADANRGVPDISDKELASIFDTILLTKDGQKKAQLIAIFDSCHSGSVSRGLPGAARARYAAPGSYRDAPIAASTVDAKDLGALIIAATHSQETAAERQLGEAEKFQGIFTYALLQALRSPDAQREPVERIFLRISAIMAANGSTQEPVLIANTARAAQSFIPGSERASDGRSAVAVVRADGTTIELDGGLALGLQQGAKLLRLGDGPRVELTVGAVTGMSRSKCVVSAGSAAAVKVGDLFTIEHYGTPQANALKVFIPRAGPRGGLARLTSQLSQLQRDPSMWVADPTSGAASTHVLTADDKGWLIRDRAGTQIARLSKTLRAADVRAALRSVQAPRLFVHLPYPSDVALPLPADPSARSTLLVVNDPTEADYQLVGRFDQGVVSYAWVLPGAQDDGPSVPFALPARSAWVAFRPDGGFGDELAKRAWRLNKVKSWLTLTPPLPSDPGFPYQLVLKRTPDGKTLAPNDVIRVGEVWMPQLNAESPRANLPRRYYYLFSIDRDGRGDILFPKTEKEMGEAMVPDMRVKGASSVVLINKEIFAIANSAFGAETLILVASSTPIQTATSVFTFDGVRGGAGRPADPLSALLFDVGEDQRGPSSDAAPIDWSIQRIPLRSAAK